MDRFKEGKKVSYISIIGNILLALIKIIIGYITGSSALIADGFHSFSDIISTIGVLIAIRISNLPPDKEHQYGHGNAEPIAAKILGIILLFTGALLAINSGKLILQHNFQKLGLIAFWAAIISILVKETMFRYTYRVGKETGNQALIADAWHHRSDAISSVAAAIGIMGSYLGYPILDPVAGLIVALMIIKVGWDIIKDAVNSLMDTAPPDEKLESLYKLAESVNGVEKVSELKAHYNGVDLFVDIKIQVDYRITVLEGHQIASEVKKEIFNQNSETIEVLVHVNPMFPGVN